jgi:hypothetical protein
MAFPAGYIWLGIISIAFFISEAIKAYTSSTDARGRFTASIVVRRGTPPNIFTNS